MLPQVVQGRLVNNEGLPIPNAILRIYQADITNSSFVATAITSPNGMWKTSLQPGKYIAECVMGDEITTQTFIVGVAPTRKFSPQDYREIKAKY